MARKQAPSHATQKLAPKGGQKVKTAAKPTVKKAPELWPILVAYSWNRNKRPPAYDEFVFTIDRNGALIASKTPSDGEIKRLDRFIFYSLPPAENPEPLIVLDTIPNEGTNIKIEESAGGKTSLTIKAKVRTLLMARGFVDITVRIEQANPKGPVVYRTFTFFESNTATKKNILDGMTGVPQALAATNEAQPFLAIPGGPFAPGKLGSTLGLNLAEDAVGDLCSEAGVPADDISKLKIFFVRLGTLSGANAGAGPYVICFGMIKQDGSKCIPPTPTDNLLSFRGRPRIAIDSELLRRQSWKLLQRPSINLSVGPKAPPAIGENWPASEWVFQVHGVPTKGIPTLWNEEFAKPYYAALNTVQSGRPVSFLPFLDEISAKPVAATRWAMAYAINDPTDDDDPRYSAKDEPQRVKFAGLSLQPVGPKTLPVTLTGALRQLKDHEDLDLTVKLQVAGDVEDANSNPTVEKANNFEKFPGILLPCRKAVENSAEQSIRMGALDLRFGKLQTSINSDQNIFLVTPEDVYFAVHIDSDFFVSRVGPGGQDDLPGEEFVPEAGENFGQSGPCVQGNVDVTGLSPQAIESLAERNFRRKNPLVIVRDFTVNPNDKFLLHVSEHAQKRGSQTIRLNLLNNSGAGNRDKEQVVILDRNPFLVALVEFDPFSIQTKSGGSSIGNWTNAGLEGTNWQLRTDSKPFDLVLPPQGVGEEMEKSHTLTKDPQNQGKFKPADFRFTRPAKLTLDPNFFQQSFSEAPWNLRRILGYPGQRSPGPAIKHIQFELLYGLSCDITYPFLRLAEISALTGAIPGRLPRDIRWPATKAQEECFLQARLNWSMLYRRYLSRVGILEPWDTHRPESLVLNEGMVCRIRPTQAVGGNSDPPAELQDPVNELEPSSTGLKGGVTWGFESRNVYNAVLNNPPARTSTSAGISEPYFSSLGAWGRLQSSFDQNRSTIYADAAMGRTYYYKLERIGRIACWWNKAKHVIVYERTVIPSRQFGLGDQQDRHEGIALVRKVKEYVEILEKTRTYPDGGVARTAQEQDALEQHRGCVADCTFEEGAKFAVLSSWGSDVGDIGWKVPIWNRTATPPDVYPKPNVKFGLYTNVDGQSVPVPRRCDNPENVYFYTDTRKETGSNPNDWPPIKDVDYCDLPRPSPRTDFQDGNKMQTTPDDPDVHPGFAPCTFAFEPTALPADLVAARAATPLAAVLQNITMMRAAAIDSAKADGAHPAAQTLRRLADRIADAYSEILRAVPATKDAQTAALNQIVQRVRDSFNSGKFKTFRDDLKNSIDALKQQEAELTKNITDREAELFLSLRSQTDKLAADVIADYSNSIEQIIRGIPNHTAAEIKQAAVDNIKRQIRALQEGLMILRASPGMLQKMIKRYADAAPQIKTAKSEAQRISTLVDTFSDPLTQSQLAVFAREGQKLIQVVDLVDQALSAAGHRRPEEWIPDPTRTIFEKFFAGGELKFRQVRRALEDELVKINNAGVTLAKPAAKALIDNLGVWNEAEVGQLANDAEAFVEERLQTLITPWIKEREDELTALITNNPTAAQINATLDKLKLMPAKLQDELRQLESQVNTQSEKLKALVTGEAAKLEAQLKNLTSAEIESVLAVVDKLREKIEAQRDEFFGAANDYVDKNIRRLLPAAESIYSVADPAIRIVRAFGRPPEVPNLTFQRPAVAYFYKEASKIVDITPVLSRVRQASEALEALKPVGVDLPTEKLLEKLIPPDLRNFKLSDIFPNFAGLDLSNLFSGLRMPRVANDNLKINQGADVQTGRAWVEANIDITTEEPATVFAFGPVTLRLPTARFQASARFEATLNEPPRRTVSGVISGDWELTIAGMKLVIFRRTELRFDDAGGLRFGISPNNIELPGVLAFVSDLLSTLGGSDNGFSVGLLPTGVKAQLILPVPDIQGGTSGISNLTLGMVLKIQFADQNFGGAFTISLSFLLARKEKPFTITIFILGGGGYVDLTTAYAPSQQRLASSLEVGLTAGASLGLSLGPIHGSVYVFFGVTARFAIDTRPAPETPPRGLTFGVLLIIGGEVSVLGIINASITLLLEVLYSSGRLIGHGRISIKIEICWCFTLEVEEDVTYEVGSGESQHKTVSNGSRPSLVAHHAQKTKTLAAETANSVLPDPYDRFAGIYINMLT